MSAATPKRRAETYDEIKPLVELIKAGRLFEVQEWIAAGQPLDAPPPPPKGARKRNPLETAIETGFHSMVQVLLDGGATIEPAGYGGPMSRVLELRRLDLVMLLVDHGFDPRIVNMVGVFYTWDPAIMEYFIERGADVETGYPLAEALRNRVQSALGIFKRYKDRFQSFQLQADIALRYHCQEGNMKWVSLMLWAGADPYAKGLTSCDDDPDSIDAGMSALGWAALYRHYDVLHMKRIRLDPANPATWEIASHVRGREGVNILADLLRRGLNPNDQANGGSSLLYGRLTHMDWDVRFTSWRHEKRSFYLDGNDPEGAREELRAVHLLAKYGAKWIPEDKRQVGEVRKSLLKLAPDYTVEFVWIMSKYRACSVQDLEAVLRTPRMKAHLAKHAGCVRLLLKNCRCESSNVE